MKFFITLILILMASLPAVAGETAQALLHELTMPAAPELDSSSAMAIGADVGQLGVQSKENEAVASLFTLEELHEKPANLPDLELPEADLPLADIPLTMNSKVEYFLYYFQTRGKESFSRWLARSSRYIPMMKEILKRESMPEDLVYVAMIESGFHLHAKSFANAVGPWQFISGTGKRYDLRIDQWVDERKDPVKATTAAARYLKELYTMFNGDWYLAAAGYNAGENKILRAINKYNTSDFWEISRGSYLARETKEYVPKLLAAAIIAKEPARFGFSDIAYLPAIEFDTVTIPSRTDLKLIAELSGTTYETIKELNPDIRHWCTPPNYPDYELKIPKGAKSQFLEEFTKVPEDKRYTERAMYAHYRARKSDNLKKVARKYGMTVAALAELNGINPKTKIAGRTLTVLAKQTVNFSSEGRERHNSPGSTKFAKYYTVKKGDTLASLSKRFNVSSRLLSTWNNIKHKVALKPGRRIVVARFYEKNGELHPVQIKS